MFRFDENKTYRMPVHFGGSNVPAPDMEVHNYDTVGLSFVCTTDKELLSNYIPEAFELIRPEIVYGFGQMREIDWLAGGRYNVVTADVPVRFTGKKDQVEGIYNLVTWENNATPIIGGREENGVPKIFADIQDLHARPAAYFNAPDYFTNASYDGNTFVRMAMRNPKPIVGAEFEALKAAKRSYNLLCWRYIPKVSGAGAELSQPILYPQGIEMNSAWTGKGEIEWIRLRPEYNPMQHHIITALAGLPIKSIDMTLLSRAVSVLKPSQGRVIE
jgi:acetoacetate decarboxylase